MGCGNAVTAGGLHGEQRVPSHPDPWGALTGSSPRRSQVEICERWCWNLNYMAWANLDSFNNTCCSFPAPIDSTSPVSQKYLILYFIPHFELSRLFNISLWNSAAIAFMNCPLALAVTVPATYQLNIEVPSIRGKDKRFAHFNKLYLLLHRCYFAHRPSLE